MTKLHLQQWPVST